MVTLHTMNYDDVHSLHAGGGPCWGECALLIFSPLPFKQSESATVWEERALAMLTFDQGLINEFEAGLRQRSI